MSILSRVSRLFSRRANTPTRSRAANRGLFNRTRRRLGHREISSTSQVKRMTINELIEIPPDEFKFTKIHMNELDTDKKTLLTIMQELKRDRTHLTSTEIDAKYQQALQLALEHELGLSNSDNPVHNNKSSNVENVRSQNNIELSKIKTAAQQQFKNTTRTQMILARALARNIGSSQSKKWSSLDKSQRNRLNRKKKFQLHGPKHDRNVTDV